VLVTVSDPRSGHNDRWEIKEASYKGPAAAVEEFSKALSKGAARSRSNRRYFRDES
jgi:hypothetical protein